MFRRIPFYLMSIAEASEFGKAVYEAVNHITKEEFMATQMPVQLAGVNQKMLDAKKKFTTKELTKLKKGVDNVRVGLWSALKYLGMSAQRRKSEDLQKAGSFVLNSMNKHGKEFSKMNNTDQSFAINAFSNEVNTNSELKAAIVTISGTDCFNELFTVQGEYTELDEQRTDKKVSEVKFTATEVVKEVEQACENIFQYVEVMHRISPDPQYAKFIETINVKTDELITRINKRNAEKVQETELEA